MELTADAHGCFTRNGEDGGATQPNETPVDLLSIDQLTVLAAALFIKHMLCDGPLQTGAHVRGKAIFLHPAGLAHASVHAAFTLAVLLVWSAWVGLGVSAVVGLALGVAVAEFVFHYLVDHLKARADKALALSREMISADGSREIVISKTLYFHFFLFDQLVHSLTYIVIVYVVAVSII